MPKTTYRVSRKNLKNFIKITSVPHTIFMF